MTPADWMRRSCQVSHPQALDGSKPSRAEVTSPTSRGLRLRFCGLSKQVAGGDLAGLVPYIPGLESWGLIQPIPKSLRRLRVLGYPDAPNSPTGPSKPRDLRPQTPPEDSGPTPPYEGPGSRLGSSSLSGKTHQERLPQSLQSHLRARIARIRSARPCADRGPVAAQALRADVKALGALWERQGPPPGRPCVRCGGGTVVAVLPVVVGLLVAVLLVVGRLTRACLGSHDDAWGGVGCRS